MWKKKKKKKKKKILLFKYMYLDLIDQVDVFMAQSTHKGHVKQVNLPDHTFPGQA